VLAGKLTGAADHYAKRIDTAGQLAMPVARPVLVLIAVPLISPWIISGTVFTSTDSTSVASGLDPLFLKPSARPGVALGIAQGLDAGDLLGGHAGEGERYRPQAKVDQPAAFGGDDVIFPLLGGGGDDLDLDVVEPK
jgi:hypothetical protein